MFIFAVIMFLYLMCVSKAIIANLTHQATFNGGIFIPGTGCTQEVCGVQTNDGNALQVLYGKAIIKGGQFEGNIYSMSGDIEIHGCVEHDGERIAGYLLDGNKLDVKFDGQQNNLDIVYDEKVCQGDLSEATDDLTSNAHVVGGAMCNTFAITTCLLVGTMMSL